MMFVSNRETAQSLRIIYGTEVTELRTVLRARATRGTSVAPSVCGAGSIIVEPDRR